MPTRRRRRSCSAGRQPRRWKTCAATRGAGRKRTRTAIRTNEQWGAAVPGDRGLRALLRESVLCRWLILLPCRAVSLRRGIASAEATKGLSDRPLETFGATHVTMLYCCLEKRKAHKLNQFRYKSSNMGVQGEGVQRATAKPSGYCKQDQLGRSHQLHNAKNSRGIHKTPLGRGLCQNFVA